MTELEEQAAMALYHQMKEFIDIQATGMSIMDIVIMIIMIMVVIFSAETWIKNRIHGVKKLVDFLLNRK